MKIIVGLGNPGKEYTSTRHNIGFWVVDELAAACGSRFKKSRYQAEAATFQQGNQKIILVKPSTYMNLSGEAVGRALRFFKKTPEALLVIHDDLDLPLGRIKFSQASSSGGHNGIESIIESLNTKDFTRLRVGISRPGVSGDVVDYVLSPFSRLEKRRADETTDLASEAIQYYLKNGLRAAMNRYNRGTIED